MELGLSLGDTSRLKEKPCEGSNQLGLGFNTTLSIGPVITKQIDQHQQEEESPNQNHKSHTHSATEQDHEETRDESLNLTSTFPKDLDNTVFQLDLLPHTTPAVAPMNPPSNIFSWDHLSEDGKNHS
ncbi:unnamed protein product [Sphenostylis stenocarpa]|uniref:Uncharacterized protein n=1 Tax=Sphenostylis stenocarpa TaxID=92480 RepID=A0AA87B8H4_9FABA|nr:unnamed protein product [Sphenostylis stenocarpa]